ncbi:hypothetical protein EN794_034125 [Mesorhizobium sp. M00.F.Ca.ET.151.01.1.1]|uniref:Uncharacterized protein n=1 Tax=Stenotrophomonas pavanii TaxID=487698 RepID=A0A246L334_9GAMM|nr:hypothetical protein D1178_18845 [Stenotrophomonas maltophilia]OWR35140.1 hypothetical protein CEE55_02800 [Stenotrophomonas pavanii]TGR46322.1 hypothetical protein EN842_26180 [bacterium M00.F.Ca.ET.199.01.1.1]TGT01613.1 hypothetical protein EN820_29015 [bacterium M00.F.Ca.ET.177.01.1.1]TGT59198.1 hypothetical protein EN813_030870 [Mesorhizobium sp. M00.F.Ca.ET.170.01.1.1]TGU10983.1 hypothetical protein EN806_24290 [bacterium M00.F.Ca.ET.163.01.1.1]TGU92621.1 hypothetical protein EN794_03
MRPRATPTQADRPDVRRWPSLASNEVDFYCRWTWVGDSGMRVPAVGPPAAGSLDPRAMQVNPLALRQAPAWQVVLVPAPAGAHNGAVALATPFPRTDALRASPMTRYSHA